MINKSLRFCILISLFSFALHASEPNIIPGSADILKAYRNKRNGNNMVSLEEFRRKRNGTGDASRFNQRNVISLNEFRRRRNDVTVQDRSLQKMNSLPAFFLLSQVRVGTTKVPVQGPKL